MNAFYASTNLYMKRAGVNWDGISPEVTRIWATAPTVAFADGKIWFAGRSGNDVVEFRVFDGTKWESRP